MKHAIRIGSLALASALSLASAAAWAQTPTAQQDKAQLKADQTTLIQDKAAAAKDEAALRLDKADGRMAGQSRDSMHVYTDKQDIKGLKKDIASDHKPSLQRKADKTSLRHEEAKLAHDKTALKSGRKEGLLAATSPDGEKVYRDKQAIKGEEKDIAADKAALSKDAK